jgi:serine/threonine protein kinase
MCVEEEPVTDIPYRVGDVLTGGYEIKEFIGKGGFGTVFLVHSQILSKLVAMKTFNNEYFRDFEVLSRFRREARVLLDIGIHPNIIRTYFVDKISDRLHIFMEYIPKNEQKINTLEGYLTYKPPNRAQSLRWAIQFCHGMEFANQMGVKCHRDIKPQNIMITPEGLLKISDFGFVDTYDSIFVNSSTEQPDARASTKFQTQYGVGTLTHMAPEQFNDPSKCDVRSDIYSFGIVLYQMVFNGNVPYPIPSGIYGDKLRDVMKFMHNEVQIPIPDGKILPSWINRCLEKDPNSRYQSFKALRIELESVLKTLTGEIIIPPAPLTLDIYDEANRVGSLFYFGYYEDSIKVCIKILKEDPNNIAALGNKANCKLMLGLSKRALELYNRILDIDSNNAYALCGKGAALAKRGHYEGAIKCYDQLLTIDPTNFLLWAAKGACYKNLELHEEAIRCFKTLLNLNPQYYPAWYGKGYSEIKSDKPDEAIRSYQRYLEYAIPELDGELITNANAILAELKEEH